MAKSIDELVKYNKSNWPMTVDKTVDWEFVFEDKSNGFISAISQAQKSDALTDCAGEIVKALFSRESDGDIRSRLTANLASIAMDNADEDFDAALERVSSFLRDIKKERIKGANEWAAHKAKREAARKEIEARNSAPAPDEKAAISPPRINVDETELMFEDIFCDGLDRRYQVLWAGVPQEPMDGRKLPFTVSAEFARRMITLVRTDFMPIIIPRCRHIIAAAKNKDLDLRAEHIRDEFANDYTRKELWEIWKDTWRQVMQEVELPKKPAKKQSGMLKSLVNVVRSITDDADEYTLEDWEIDVETAKMQHATVHENWKMLTEPSKDFEPPLDEDKLLLMNMYGKTTSGLRSQISSLRQIAQQSSGTAGKALDKLATGKDIQLALIAVVHQYPDMFLGKKMLIRDMMFGKDKDRLKQQMPLVVRYLGQLF